MKIVPSYSSSNIVLLGHFNPMIFRPDWFARNDIISQEESDSAEIEVIHRDIVAFKTDWLSLRVEKNRFIAETEKPPYVMVYDFVVKTFKENLIHTPAGVLGINRRIDFEVKDEETYQNFGDLLAPKKAWGEWGKELERGNNISHNGLLSITMDQKVFEDDARPKGFTRVTIEASKRIQRKGVHIHFLDHYETNSPEEAVGCDEIIEVLENYYDNSVKKADWIFDEIMKLV